MGIIPASHSQSSQSLDAVRLTTDNTRNCGSLMNICTIMFTILTEDLGTPCVSATFILSCNVGGGGGGGEG
jgi:hypothetical protein